VQTLGAVGRLINSALDIEELLKLTIQKMAEVMQAEICMLFLKEGEDRVVLKQSFGMPVIPGASYEIGKGVTGSVAGTGVAKLIVRTDENDGKYDSEIRTFLAEKHGEPKDIESLMVVPIIAKGTILGVMKVINKIGDHLEYGLSDLEFFRAFADYVGVAIENAQTHKNLSRLVSAVAHEINNTSGVIPANVAGIKTQLDFPNESIKRMLALIEDAASQATEFANEIAGFSVNRIGEKRPLNVNGSIKLAIETIDLSKYKVPEKITLSVSLCDNPLVCDIYERPFIQIVRNIIINAFQALENKQGGAVSVSSSEDINGSARIAVIRFEDNGPGIKPEHKSRIFDDDFTTKAKGNGVGLWLVRTQLQQIGGKIEVESEPGWGARFIVKIPLAMEGGGTNEAAHTSTDS
jgi:signal transduction histidine kinase